MRSFFTEAWRRGLLILVLPLAMAGVLRADEVTDWHEHMLTAMGNPPIRPPVSTREASLVSAAVFDAVNGVERRYAHIHVPAAAPRGTSKRAAAVQAAYAVLVSRFPGQAANLNAKRAASLAAIGDPATEASVRRGIEWGQFVAEEILAWRSTDGFVPPPPAPSPNPPYLGGDDPGQWRPTPTGFAPGLVPEFATMPPWGILSSDQFRAPGPPALDSQRYRDELDEVRLMGRKTDSPRSADQTAASEFAANTSATYVWNTLAIDLAADHGFELSDNALLLARLNLAMADAVIACWDAKYHFEFWRPVTAIRLLDADSDGILDDPDWTPLLATPPHPEYTSGHSSNYGAAATVLSYYFGDDTPIMLQSQADPTSVRVYPSFSAAIGEVADARVFAGIHFRSACDDAVTASREVAIYILENRMWRIHGEGE